MRLSATAKATATSALLFAALFSCSSSGWREIDSIDTLQSAFTADEGHVRLVLLLSPT